jgi:hypothetical protein
MVHPFAAISPMCIRVLGLSYRDPEGSAPASGIGRWLAEQFGQRRKAAVELVESTRPEDLRDPHLGGLRLGVDGLPEPPSLRSELDDPSSSVGRIGYPHEVSLPFQVPQEVIDRLFGDAGSLRQRGRTEPVETRMAPKPDVGGVQVVVSRRHHTVVHLIPDPLPKDTQHGPDVGAWLFAGVVPSEGIA